MLEYLTALVHEAQRQGLKPSSIRCHPALYHVFEDERAANLGLNRPAHGPENRRSGWRRVFGMPVIHDDSLFGMWLELEPAKTHEELPADG